LVYKSLTSRDFAAVMDRARDLVLSRRPNSTPAYARLRGRDGGRFLIEAGDVLVRAVIHHRRGVFIALHQTLFSYVRTDDLKPSAAPDPPDRRCRSGRALGEQQDLWGFGLR
jgi:hypothetical protein